MDRTVRWAVCGLGGISRRFLKVASGLPGTKVVACVSSSKERALQYQEKYGLEAAYTYEELALNPHVVDAVYVCNYTSMHCKTAMMFLKAGIPVLCEKSLCLSKADAEKMIACAAENNTLLMEAMWTRFLPSAQFVRELAASGRMGSIKGIRARFEAGIGHAPGSRVFTKAAGGGSVFDLGVYPTTYAHMLLGVPQSISAEGKLNKEGVDLCCNAEFGYKDGAVVKFRTSLIFLQIHETLYIDFEKGTVKIPRFYQAKRLIIKHADGTKEKHSFEKTDGFKYEILHFNDLVRGDKKESPIMTHKATVEVMGILEEMNRQLGVTF